MLTWSLSSFSLLSFDPSLCAAAFEKSMNYILDSLQMKCKSFLIIFLIIMAHAVTAKCSNILRCTCVVKVVAQGQIHLHLNGTILETF